MIYYKKYKKGIENHKNYIDFIDDPKLAVMDDGVDESIEQQLERKSEINKKIKEINKLLKKD